MPYRLVSLMVFYHRFGVSRTFAAISHDGRLFLSAVDLSAGGQIDIEFQTEAVMSAEEVGAHSTALRLLSVS